MKLKIGDLVRFVDEAIEGHITSFQDENIIGVTDESGFEIPVSIDKVTLVHGNMQRDDDEEAQTLTPVGPFIEQGIYFAVTGDQKEGLAQFYIVNETSYELLISINEKINNDVKGLSSVKLAPKESNGFHKANFSNIGKWPTFLIHIIRHSETVQKSKPLITKEVRMKPTEINNPKEKQTLLNQKAWLIELDPVLEDIGIEKLKNFGK